MWRIGHIARAPETRSKIAKVLQFLWEGVRGLPAGQPATSQARQETVARDGSGADRDSRAGHTHEGYARSVATLIVGNRFTITCLRATRTAPCASVAELIIGSSSGVRPMASASGNRTHSSEPR